MSVKRCAYLTMASTEGWSIDADLGFVPLEARGWQVEAVPWRSAPDDWDRFDAVYIGVPWDYPEDPDAFLELLDRIDRSRAVLVNDISLVHWSLPKTYLRDLESGGAAIVPSLWYDDMRPGLAAGAFDRFGVDRIIVKPVVSTNATDTFLLTREELTALEGRLCEIFRQRPFVIQPFVASIVTDGEFSLFYFNREFSHAIRKVPKPGDFRVQEEHGATITAVNPDADLLAAGECVMALVEPMPAYARADFVRAEDGRYMVMELELIEPSMYLRIDPKAPERFAEAFDLYVRKKWEELVA